MQDENDKIIRFDQLMPDEVELILAYRHMSEPAKQLLRLAAGEVVK